MRLPIAVATVTLMAGPSLCRALPSPANSSTPTHINLVGALFGAPDTTLGGFDIVVRDLANNPRRFSVVVLDFSGCPDCVLATDQLAPGSTVDCLHRTVTGNSGPEGTWRLAVLGSSKQGSGTPGPNSVIIYADGVRLGAIPVGILDLDGRGGLTVADLSVWVHDFLSPELIGRADFNGDGAVNSADLAIWAAAFSAGRSRQSAGPGCP